MNVLKRFKAWRGSYDDNFELLETEKSLFDEVERILEKAEKSSCEGCKYSGDASFNGMKVCTECCNNYYNKWTEKKTRQSEFLKMFPNAPLDSGSCLPICPCKTERTIIDSDGRCRRRKEYGDCDKCREIYWNEEME